MLKRGSLVLGSLLVLAAGSAGAGSWNASASATTARSYGVQVSVPGAGSGGSSTASAPPETALVGPGGSWGVDPSVITTGAVTGHASADPTAATASASAEVDSISLFGGDLTVGSVIVKAEGSGRPGTAVADISGSGVSGVTVLGAPVAVGPGSRVALGDWGYAVFLSGSAASGSTSHASIVGMDAHTTAEHNGVPAGTSVRIGYAEANVEAPPLTQTQPPTTTTAQAPPPPAPKKTSKPPAVTPPATPPPVVTEPTHASPFGGTGVRPATTNVHPKLTARHYVFPVYGPSSYTDTFGAARSDVGWHHGDDIFAPLGAPVLAVADGTVFSVGWNDIGGYRLWLRDRDGNEFYYAHLSAYSPLAVNGTHVRAGQILGFVGNTGDAQTTPYHLHFEVHPVGLLGYGYDGSAVDPTGYLDAWRHLQDIGFAAGANWAPSPNAQASAPQAGAILLQVSDISTASGLEPGSLRRALRPLATEGEGGFLTAPAKKPANAEGGAARAAAARR